MAVSHKLGGLLKGFQFPGSFEWFGVVTDRFRADPDKDYMAVPISWGGSFLWVSLQ